MKKLLLLFSLLFTIICFSQNRIDYINIDSIRNNIATFSKNKEFDKIVKYLDDINKNDSIYNETIITKSYYLIQQKKYEESIAVLNEALNKPNFENRHDLFLNKAASYLNLLDYENAIKTLDDGLVEFPKSYLFYYNKGNIFNESKKYNEAVKMLEMAAIINPFYASTYLKLGNICYQLGLTSQALLSFNIYLMLNPDGNGAFAILNSLDKLLKKGNVNNKNEEIQVSKDDSVFEEVDMVLESKVSLDEGYEFNNDININYVRQNHVLFQLLETIDTNDDFWGRRVLKLHRWILANNYFDDFIYTTTFSIENPEFKKIVEKKRDEVIAFIGKFRKEWESIMQLNELEFNEEKQMVSTNFINSVLEGIGVLKSGIPNGYWEFYTDNGKISSTGYFNEQGKRTGKWTWYYTNGNMKESAIYIDGKLDGENLGFYKNKAQKYIANYKDDTLDGKYEYFRENGASQETKFFLDGNLDNLYTSYYPTTNLSKEYIINYKNGEPIGDVIQYYSNGLIQYKVNYVQGKKQGIERSYYENGVISLETEMVDGKINGNFKSFYKNGVLKEEGMCTDDLRNGPWRSYYSNSKLKCESSYVNGELQGVYKEYSNQGKLYNTFDYKNDELIAFKYFNLDGSILKEARKKGGDFYYEGFESDGSKTTEGLYDVEGGKEGLWKYYSSSGVKIQEVFYKNNMIQGDVKNYHLNDTLESKMTYVNDTLSGYYTSFFKNGQMNCEGWYKNNSPSKEWKFYYKNGTIKSINFYHKGDFHGVQKYFSVEGKISNLATYEYGKLLKEVTFSNDGEVINTIVYKPSNEETIIELKHFNNKLKSKTTYKFGLKNGHYQEFDFYGNKIIEGNYLNDLPEGKWLFYHKNGKISKEINYVLGNIDGLVISYYESGNIEDTYSYIIDDRYGESISYIDDGKTIANKTSYIEGSKQGRAEFYSKKGELQLIRFYEYGKLIGYSYLDKKGVELPMIPIKNETAKIISFYKNGNKAREFEVVNGLFENEYKTYSENGILISSTFNLNGEDVKKSVTYFEKGSIKEETMYSDDEKNGIHKIYYENEQLKEENNYINDEKSGVSKYYNNEGKMLKLEKYFNGSIYEVEIY